MPHSVRPIDRLLRITLGMALICASVLGWIGSLPLATGVFRLCPACWPFGLNT